MDNNGLSDRDFVQASKVVSYGLDTASRVYGLDTVLAAVQNVDEARREAENPLGAIYERLAPTSEAQEHLYGEMKRDLEKPQRAAFVLPTADDTLRVGRNAQGEFFEKNPENGWPERSHEASISTIRSLKKIIEALDSDELFAKVREEAQAVGLSPLEFLVQAEINPTLSYFLNQVGAATGIEMEELLVKTAKMSEEEILDIDTSDSKMMEETVEWVNNAEILEEQDEVPEAELGEIQDLGLPEEDIDTNKRDFRELEELSLEVVDKTELEDDIDVDEWFEKAGGKK